MFSCLLYFSCSGDLNATVLSMFCSEGDNGVDGIELVSYLNEWKEWTTLNVR